MTSWAMRCDSRTVMSGSTSRCRSRWYCRPVLRAKDFSTPRTPAIPRATARTSVEPRLVRHRVRQIHRRLPDDAQSAGHDHEADREAAVVIGGDEPDRIETRRNPTATSATHADRMSTASFEASAASDALPMARAARNFSLAITPRTPIATTRTQSANGPGATCGRPSRFSDRKAITPPPKTSTMPTMRPASVSRRPCPYG